VIPANPERLICNHNLFDVHPCDLSATEILALQAIANSTLVANFKTFYGRYAGTEGNLKTEVVDVNLLEIPDPRHATAAVAAKLRDAFGRLCQRDTRPLVEEDFMECHSAERARKLAEKPSGLPLELQASDRRDLDLAVFELLGVESAKEREALCDELYRETAAHFRQIRVVEIQKQEQRARTADREFRTDELATDLWDSLTPEEKRPLTEWLAAQAGNGAKHLIPDGQPRLPDAGDMLDANTVFFKQRGGGKTKAVSLALPTRSHAEALFKLAALGFRGPVALPDGETAARDFKRDLDARTAAIAATADRLARSRTSDEGKANDMADLLRRWLIHGRENQNLG
jgi:hypothetical protein